MPLVATGRGPGSLLILAENIGIPEIAKENHQPGGSPDDGLQQKASRSGIEVGERQHHVFLRERSFCQCRDLNDVVALKYTTPKLICRFFIKRLIVCNISEFSTQRIYSKYFACFYWRLKLPQHHIFMSFGGSFELDYGAEELENAPKAAFA